MRRFLTFFSAFCLLFLTPCLRAEASDAWYTNPDTGYRVVVEDDAGLLTNRELNELADLMEEITQYGNVAFKTVDDNSSSTQHFAEKYYKKLFGRRSGTLFLIDMDNRNIWIWSNGDIYDVVTKGYADTITDNCYRYATRGDYYLCAEEAFSEIATLLNGYKIAQPMKYISNALLALILAFLLNYIIVRLTSKSSSDRQILLEGTHRSFQLTNARAEFVVTTVEHIESASSGGGGGGGGRGGGGGSRGGGGGHRF